MATASPVEVLTYIAVIVEELRALASSIASEKLLSLLEESAVAAREQIDDLPLIDPNSEN